MRSDSSDYLLFKTNLFLCEQRDEDIDRWRLGGDCAGWFYVRLLVTDRIRPNQEPVMEDWGWTFAVEVDRLTIRLNLWEFLDGNCWLIGFESESYFFRGRSSLSTSEAKAIVRNGLERIVANDPRFDEYRWFDRNPLELKVDVDTAFS